MSIDKWQVMNLASQYSSLRQVPLRLKLVASVLALVGVALLVISAGSTLALHSYLIDKIDAELRIASQALQASAVTEQLRVVLPTDYLYAIATPSHVGTLHYDSRFFEADELPVLPEDYEGFARQQDVPHTVQAPNHRMRWRLLMNELPNGAMMAVGKSMIDVDEAVTRLVWIDILVGSAVLMLLALVGAAIVRTSLRPLVEIERTAAAIAAGDLTQRVPNPELDGQPPLTELGRLSRALNAMLTQVETAFTARAASESAARRSEERMRQFVADASHELRTPLTTIRGFAELYRQGAVNSPQETARLLRRIEDEASRMGLLVEDLLLLARLDQERPVELAPVELRVVAAETVQAACALAPERQIQLQSAPDAGHLVVLGDDSRLRQVLSNLVTNALTHTPPDASVTVRLYSEPGNMAVIEVVDTGQGLTPEQAERVFERFYRVDAARTRRADGVTSTGLGLAIVAALVTAHHGAVDVQSTPGAGTTFRVRLPLATATEQTPEPGILS